MISFMFVFIAVGFGSASAAAPTLGFGSVATPSTGEYEPEFFTQKEQLQNFVTYFTVNKSREANKFILLVLWC